MRAVRPADQDRLPWLEPYKDTKAGVKSKPGVGSRKSLVAGIGAVLLVAAGAGGYWLGQQQTDRKPPASQTVALAPAKSPPERVQIAEAPAPTPTPTAKTEMETPNPVVTVKPKSARKVARHRPVPRRKIRTAGVERAHIDAVRAQQEALAKSRRWPKMPSPGPAGQVIQLGAFTTAARANNAYQLRVARYPSLGTMPKVVVPVITKPGGRILYVLRLGTSSRQQSKIVCRNLQRSGDHCLVIG